MSPNRKMVYDFLGLPTHVQLEIGKELGLPDLEEIQADNSKAFIEWFKLAKEHGELERLRAAIEQRMP